LPAPRRAQRIETVDGHDRPVLTALDRLEEPPSLLELRAAVDALLPRVDLPEILQEVAGWTGFLTEFTHISDGRADPPATPPQPPRHRPAAKPAMH
jgi:hypothetical protein